MYILRGARPARRTGSGAASRALYRSFKKAGKFSDSDSISSAHVYGMKRCPDRFEQAARCLTYWHTLSVTRMQSLKRQRLLRSDIQLAGGQATSLLAWCCESLQNILDHSSANILQLQGRLKDVKHERHLEDRRIGIGQSRDDVSDRSLLRTNDFPLLKFT